jgi:transposase-like protein
MTTTLRRYTDKEKADAVEAVRSGDKLKDVAAMVGCNLSTVWKWCSEAKDGSPKRRARAHQDAGVGAPAKPAPPPPMTVAQALHRPGPPAPEAMTLTQAAVHLATVLEPFTQTDRERVIKAAHTLLNLQDASDREGADTKVHVL